MTLSATEDKILISFAIKGMSCWKEPSSEKSYYGKIVHVKNVELFSVDAMEDVSIHIPKNLCTTEWAKLPFTKHISTIHSINVSESAQKMEKEHDKLYLTLRQIENLILTVGIFSFEPEDTKKNTPSQKACSNQIIELTIPEKFEMHQAHTLAFTSEQGSFSAALIPASHLLPSPVRNEKDLLIQNQHDLLALFEAILTQEITSMRKEFAEKLIAGTGINLNHIESSFWIKKEIMLIPEHDLTLLMKEIRDLDEQLKLESFKKSADLDHFFFSKSFNKILSTLEKDALTRIMNSCLTTLLQDPESTSMKAITEALSKKYEKVLREFYTEPEEDFSASLK